MNSEERGINLIEQDRRIFRGARADTLTLQAAKEGCKPLMNSRV